MAGIGSCSVAAEDGIAGSRGLKVQQVELKLRKNIHTWPRESKRGVFHLRHFISATLPSKEPAPGEIYLRDFQIY